MACNAAGGLGGPPEGSLFPLPRGIGGSSPLAALVEAIAFAVHLENVDMVGEAIEERTGQALRAEGLGPRVEGQVGGDQDRAALRAG